MLADPRANAIVENFAGQWLLIRNLRNIAPNTDEFPDFDNDLRDAFERETELFFGSIMRETATCSICCAPTTPSSTSGSPSTTGSAMCTAVTSAA
jgi:hypothetical protein